MKRDIHELNKVERVMVARVFTEVRDRMITTFKTGNYVKHICTNLIAVRAKAPKIDDQYYVLALNIISLRIDYGITEPETTIGGWLVDKGNLPYEQKYRIFSTPCLNYEYRIAWLESLANECLGLPFATCYIENL